MFNHDSVLIELFLFSNQPIKVIKLYNNIYNIVIILYTKVTEFVFPLRFKYNNSLFSNDDRE